MLFYFVFLFFQILPTFILGYEQSDTDRRVLNQIEYKYLNEVATLGNVPILEIRKLERGEAERATVKLEKMPEHNCTVLYLNVRNCEGTLLTFLQAHQNVFNVVFCNYPLHVISANKYEEALTSLSGTLLPQGKLYLTHDTITDEEGCNQLEVKYPPTYIEHILRGVTLPLTWEIDEHLRKKRIIASDPRDVKKILETLGVNVIVCGIYDDDSSLLSRQISRYLGIIATKGTKVTDF